MRDRKWYDENRYRLKKGYPEILSKRTYLLEELSETEWSVKFETLMRNRLLLGALRYGRIHAPNKPIYDRISSIIKRLDIYRESGNMELLVDVANLCLLEFEECHHPDKHFSSIDDGEHVTIIKGD